MKKIGMIWVMIMMYAGHLKAMKLTDGRCIMIKAYDEKIAIEEAEATLLFNVNKYNFNEIMVSSEPSKTFWQLLEDQRWVRTMHKKYAQCAVSDNEIHAMSDAERTRIANDALDGKSVILPYSSDALTKTLSCLQAAYALNAHEIVQKYAATTATLVTCTEWLNALRADQAPSLVDIENLKPALKKSISSYISPMYHPVSLSRVRVAEGPRKRLLPADTLEQQLLGALLLHCSCKGLLVTNTAWVDKVKKTYRDNYSVIKDLYDKVVDKDVLPLDQLIIDDHGYDGDQE